MMGRDRELTRTIVPRSGLVILIGVIGLVVIGVVASQSDRESAVAANGLLPNGLFPQEAAEIARLSPHDPEAVVRRKAIEERGRNRQEAMNSPKATLLLDPAPAPPCVNGTPADDGIFAPYQPIRGVDMAETLSQARLADGLRGYALFSGSLSADPGQGIIVLFEQSFDCAEQLQIGPDVVRTPGKNGAVRLTGRDGPLVAFETTDGTLGRFNFVTREFV